MRAPESPTITAEAVYTARAVAEHLHCTPATVYALVREGELAAIHVGRGVRIPASALDDFLRRGGTRR